MNLLTDSGPPPDVPTDARGGATRGFWPMRDLPVLGWFLAILVVALAHPVISTPRWLVIHLLVLGAAGHSILVWSRYFADTLLRRPPSPRSQQTRRLLLFNFGAVAVVIGVPVGLWWLVVAGATGIVMAIGWHCATLLAGRSGFASRFAATLWFYVAAGALLLVGVVLGVWLAHHPGEPLHTQLRAAHIAVNLLGWIGLTVLGTVVSLGPTMLRTRIVEGAERRSRQALPLLIAGIAMIVTAAAVDRLWLAVFGGSVYAVGFVLVAWPLVQAGRLRWPSSFPAWSLACGLAWYGGLLATFAVRSTQVAVDHAAGPSGWAAFGAVLDDLAPVFAAGFVAQVLLGALSYLIPVVMGGGPTAVRSMNRDLDALGALRVVVVNLGLLISMLGSPGLVRVAASSLVLVSFASFIPILLVAIRRRHARSDDLRRTSTRERGRPTELDRPNGQNRGMAVLGVAVVMVAVAGAGALDPAALGGPVQSAADGVVPTGHTVRLDVTANDMRFSPAKVEIDAGDRLIVTVHNADSEQVHDLVLETGHDSGRLAPGESATIDVGVVGRRIEGWCSVIGHRQMGMVFDVVVRGAADHGPDGDEVASPATTGSGHDHSGTAAGLTDPVDPSAIIDPYLPPVAPERIHRYTFTVTEQEQEVAPGVRRTVWTYNGTAPGPTLHGRVGDTFVITLVNHGTIGHSIDFHAGQRAPDQVMRTIAPGGQLTYRFTATRAGIWMYHCSSMPMSGHIAAGLYGAVVIDPPELAPVDHEFVLTQSETYGEGPEPVDMDALNAERPASVVFNGYANGYDNQPLRVKVGERVRVWLLNAGPNRPLSFHVVGGQFDTVYAEGRWQLGTAQRPARDAGAQALALQPAQGGFVELVFDEPGRYPFVNHVMVDAERGAHGIIEVVR